MRRALLCMIGNLREMWRDVILSEIFGAQKVG